MRATLAALLGVVMLVGTANGQYAQRDKLVGTPGFKAAVDASGRSVVSSRVRAIHTTDPQLEGGTAYLIQKDPFLAYQLGRDLNFREFRMRDGVLSKSGHSSLGGPMPDGTTAKLTTQNHVSCIACHNIPNGNPGGGMNLAKDSGFGRNSPHYFGAGIVEMLGIQIRADILSQLDTDSSGWIDVAEATAGGPSVSVVPTTGATAIDFGDPSLDGGATGSPGFNNMVVVWYVDATGAHVPGATSVDGVTTFGYNFELVVWGWGQGEGRGALNPTNRAFLWDPFAAHMGLEAYDPTSNDDPDGDGIGGPSLSGAIQFPATHKSPDRGNDLHPNGYSRDDPDGDGYLNEISEGDIDLAEWFMLNLPRPAFAGTASEYANGVARMTSWGCTECHVEEWTIKAADATYAGDRRLFDFDVTWSDRNQRLEGELVSLYTLNGELHEPNLGAFTVTGIFTDFRHHDLGDGFAELGYDGVVNRQFRTAPLWGVGSSFPYGHDGASLSLRDVILRHGGDAETSKQTFLAAPSTQQDKLIEFLKQLQLYDIESTPADIDGDLSISSNFMVQGLDTGPERFNPEWLFKTPVEIQGQILNADGVTITSWVPVNIRNAYATLLQYRKDKDGDGWPAEWDVNDNKKGFKNGNK